MRIGHTMNIHSKSLREKAKNCDQMAQAERDPDMRAILLRKAEALRALADSEDWLAGTTEAVVGALNDAMSGSLAAE